MGPGEVAVCVGKKWVWTTVIELGEEGVTLGGQPSTAVRTSGRQPHEGRGHGCDLVWGKEGSLVWGIRS